MPIEKSLGLKGKAEFAGARKVLAALKRAHKIRGPVKLVGAASAPRPKRRRVARKANIGGFIDAVGRFHPIRSGERMISYQGKRVLVKDESPYSRKRAGEKAKAAKRRRKKPAAHRRKNTTYASFSRQGRKRKKANPKRMSKKQLFLRRMRLGRLRAARARNGRKR